ncbi:MAG: DUF2007 domain-containing protein [Acidobacteriota bacterium]
MPPAAEPAGPEWSVLRRTRHAESAEIIKGLLASEGIACEVVSRAFSEMPVPVATGASYFELWVPKADLSKSRELLESTQRSTVPCANCEHMPYEDEAVCEYCGAALA